MSRRRESWSRPTGLRFDFSHPIAVDADALAAVEAEVNAHIRQNDAVSTRLMTPDEAIAEGAMALFGEKYGDEVRVVSMGARRRRQIYSLELCGGTHVDALGDIGLFKIVERRRGVVGRAPRRGADRRGGARLSGRAATRSCARRRRRSSRRPTRCPRASRRWSRTAAGSSANWPRRRRRWRWAAAAAPRRPVPKQVGGVTFVGQVVDGLDPKGLRGAVDETKQRLGSGVAMIVAVNDGRASVAVGVTDDLTARLNAVDLLKQAVAALGGQGGGGRPDMAQGGGPDGAKATQRWRR